MQLGLPPMPVPQPPEPNHCFLPRYTLDQRFSKLATCWDYLERFCFLVPLAEIDLIGMGCDLSFGIF